MASSVADAHRGSVIECDGRSCTGLRRCSARALICSGRPVAAQTADIVDRSALKVCADPNNLPFSNEKKEGFENKIAELIGAALG